MGTMIEKYIDIQEHYKKLHPKPIVWYENGTFYEQYGYPSDLTNEVETEHWIGANLLLFSQDCDLKLTKKNKNNPETGIKNPYLTGIQKEYAIRFLEKCMNVGYLVILVNQNLDTDGRPIRGDDGQFQREVTAEIHSGNFWKYRDNLIYNTQKSSSLERFEGTGWIMVHPNREKSSKYFVQYAVIDWSNDKCYMDSMPMDKFTDMPEYWKDIGIHELVVISNTNEVSGMDWTSIFHCDDALFVHTKKTMYPTFKEEIHSFLEKEYPECIDIIQYSFFNGCHSTLKYYNGALQQLNIMSHSIINGKCREKNKCLFSIINRTQTSMGYRQLSKRMKYPLTSSQALEDEYTKVDWLFSHSLDVSFKGCPDLEMMWNRVQLGLINPYEYSKMFINMKKIQNIMDHPSFVLSRVEKETIHYWVELYEDTFIDENMVCTQNKMIEPIFKKNKDNMKLYEFIDQKTQIYNYYDTEYNKIIKEVPAKFTESETEGIFIELTHSKWKQIQSNIQMNHTEFGILLPTIKNNKCRLTFKKNLEIYATMKHINHCIHKEQVILLKEHCRSLQQYNGIVHDILEKFGKLDMYVSFYIIAKEYNWCRPYITTCCKDNEQENGSWIDATDLRHPIIEYISMKSYDPELQTKYIPNDISIGKKHTGYLLYGVNASGKSSLMKSVGIALVLAQMGCYVPATTFQYKPYHQLMTRLTGDDNIYQGKSSFMVELTELRDILELSNPHSLVLGDEICRGTEVISAEAIVLSSIEMLLKNKVNFIFASHLHRLTLFREISLAKENKTLGIYHMSIEERNGQIIYGRKLMEGQGSTLYGTTISSHVFKGLDGFNERMNQYLDRLKISENQEYKLEVNARSLKKKSIYNARIEMKNCVVCELEGTCRKAEETHHIHRQADFNGSRQRKNATSNLVPLCHECHVRTENPDKNGIRLLIHGWKTNIMGKRFLDYEFE